VLSLESLGERLAAQARARSGRGGWGALAATRSISPRTDRRDHDLVTVFNCGPTSKSWKRHARRVVELYSFEFATSDV
jgi:hypothetical protein